VTSFSRSSFSRSSTASATVEVRVPRAARMPRDKRDANAGCEEETQMLAVAARRVAAPANKFPDPVPA
jgi:hypothetical protein